MKLTQFVSLINSFNLIDHEKSRTIKKGKVAILSWKLAFLVYAIVFNCGQIFLKLAQFLYFINSLNPIFLKKKIRQSVMEK